MGAIVRGVSAHSSVEGFDAGKVAAAFPNIRSLDFDWLLTKAALPMFKFYTLEELELNTDEDNVVDFYNAVQNQKQLRKLTICNDGAWTMVMARIEGFLLSNLPSLESLYISLRKSGDEVDSVFADRLTKILCSGNLKELYFDEMTIFSLEQIIQIVNANKNCSLLEFDADQEGGSSEVFDYIPQITAPIQELETPRLDVFAAGLPSLPHLHTLKILSISSGCIWADTVKNLALRIFKLADLINLVTILEEFVELETLALTFHCFMPDVVNNDGFIRRFLALTKGIKVTTTFWRGDVETVFRKALNRGGIAAQLYRNLFPVHIARFECAIKQAVRQYYASHFPDDLMQITAM